MGPSCPPRGPSTSRLDTSSSRIRLKRAKYILDTTPTEKMWSDVLNKSKQDTPFRNNRVIMMDVPEDYNNNSKYRKYHPKLLPPDEKENLDYGSSTRPKQSSRSVLGPRGLIWPLQWS
jgi:hypothetical protein